MKATSEFIANLSDVFALFGAIETKRMFGGYEYEKRGKRVKMAYYAAPEEIFENPVHAREWADRAYETALRAKRLKGKARVKKSK